MLNLAFIGSRFSAQVKTNPAALSGLEVVWIGNDVDAYVSEGSATKPSVLVCELGDLGDDPQGRLEQLLADPLVERVIVTYSFARRATLIGLQRPGVRVVQGPLSLANLRAQIVDLIIRDILEDQGPPAPPTPLKSSRCPECGSRLPNQPQPA